ncbi:Transcriptional regulator [Pseudocercospora fuligena]|uniref:Transcriptional regulator n=1 Tax=Pseudocercospora fuligena TaxID=685502 RepID=A0A8H6R7P6_9PEZI|nr:Transcriptional regulator [Pseudocercospora fuligena]
MSTVAGAAPTTTAVSPTRKASDTQEKSAKEKRYKCQFCNRAFSRSEHRSRHERSHTKERPFKCQKCRSTFVRRDLLLRHDRTVHAKDGGVPLQSETKRRSNGGNKSAAQQNGNANSNDTKLPELDDAAFDQFTDGDNPLGIQQAAMLMHNFQQKAAMSGQDIGTIQTEPLITPHGPSLMDTSVFGYPGSMTLPQMHGWDQMLSASALSQPPKAPSISSAGADQHDLLSYPNSALSATGTTLPPLMERGQSQQDGLPSFGASSLMEGIHTPGALSPFPGLIGPISPVDYKRSPGPAQQCTMAKAPQVTTDEQVTRIMENIRRCDTEGALVETFRLPQINVVNRYLSTYFNFFHHHLPFIHPASFDPALVSAPLLLAVLSIGALYTFEQDQAYMLHIGSKVLVTQFLQKKDNFSSRKCPLWMMQASLLNMSFASWSGDPKGLEWACSIKSLLANMVAGNRYELKLRTDAREGRQPTHEEWIEDEGCRRTYFAVYIFFGLLTLTYNHTPAINFNEFDTLELPSSETLWNLDPTDNESWTESLTASTIITFREAHDALFQGESARYSAFATRVMINALFLEVWYHKRSPEALQDVVTEYKLRLALDTWEKSLELCEPETVVVQLSAPHKGHPLIFNANAMYRNTRARLLVDLKSVQEALRYHDSYEVAAAMTHARDNIKRSQEMLNVIQSCFDCIEVAARQGIRWVARTSATNWSIEHPLCGLDLIVILSLWLWRVEHEDEPASEEEKEMYQKLRGLFDDDTIDGFGQKLSSTVARLWGSMIDEVVVWGITKLMGESFKLHSQALIGYEDAIMTAEQNNGSTSPPAVIAPHRTEVTAY